MIDGPARRLGRQARGPARLAGVSVVVASWAETRPWYDRSGRALHKLNAPHRQALVGIHAILASRKAR